MRNLRMIPLVLVRHGQSTWNRENRFTGWTDVDLSEQGVQEAHEAARALREGGPSTSAAGKSGPFPEFSRRTSPRS